MTSDPLTSTAFILYDETSVQDAVIYTTHTDYLRSSAHLLQQHTIPQTTVAMATTIIKDAIVT